MIEVIREQYLGKDEEDGSFTDVSTQFPTAATLDVTLRDAGRHLLNLYDKEGAVVAVFQNWDYAMIVKEDGE